MPKFVEKYYSLEELWRSIDKLPSERRYLAGGTDLIVSWNSLGEDSDCWIDISDIKELRKIEEQDKFLFIGSAVKISELENNPLVKKWIPALIQAIPYYASPSIRNMATLGGNYVNASPCADGVCALAASRAKVILNFKRRKKSLSLLSIVKGPKKIGLKKDELIEGFLIPKWTHKAVFLKMMQRKLFGISKATLCMCYKAKDGILEDLNISLASVGPTIILPQKTITYLKGKKINNEVITKACELIKTEITPITDIRSEMKYREKIISVFLRRALQSVG